MREWPLPFSGKMLLKQDTWSSIALLAGLERHLNQLCDRLDLTGRLALASFPLLPHAKSLSLPWQTIYSVGDVDEDSPLLREKLKADRYADGSPVYTPLVAVSLLVFFVLALQCMSTLAIARRETNTWRWPAVMWLYMTGLAYLFSLVIYQGGQALGLG